mgnify:FL=1|jgi:hypothetical protein
MSLSHVLFINKNRVDIIMQLIFRILDSDINRLKSTEATLLKLIRKYGFDADVYQVTEMLEHGRLGVADALPALEINDIVVSKGTPFTADTLGSLFEKLYTASLRENGDKA